MVIPPPFVTFISAEGAPVSALGPSCRLNKLSRLGSVAVGGRGTAEGRFAPLMLPPGTVTLPVASEMGAAVPSDDGEDAVVAGPPEAGSSLSNPLPDNASSPC